MFTIESENLPNEALQQKVLTLEVYSESVIATRHDTNQKFEVSPESLQRVFANVSLSSGLLPARTLFFERLGHQVKVGIHVPAAVYSVKVASNTGPDEVYHIPIPNLVFAGLGRTYGIYALKGSDLSEGAKLYHAPFPNVDLGGRICFGDLNVAEAQASTIHAVFTDFMQSRFNHDLSGGKSKTYKNDIVDLWQSIQNIRRFPVKELIPLGNSRMANLIANNSGRADRDE